MKRLSLILLLFSLTALAEESAPEPVENPIIRMIVSSARKLGVDPYKALAIVKVESGQKKCKPEIDTTLCLNPNALLYEPKFKTYSVGLFQVFLPTARLLGFTGSLKQLQKPETNIHYGLSHMKKCGEEMGESIHNLACCHQAGWAARPSVCVNNKQVRTYIVDVKKAYKEWLKVNL